MARFGRTLLTAAVVGSTAATVVPAGAAAANPYTGKEICGSTYALAKDYPLRSNNGAVQMGRIQLWYSGMRSNSCAVVIKTRQVGTPTYTSVTAAKWKRDQRNLDWKSDGGNFSYYAGPVYLDKVPGCIRIGGYMNVPGGREGLWSEPGWTAPNCELAP